MLQVATASIEDMRDLSRAPLTLLASLISVSCLSLFAYSVTDVCQEGTASVQSHDNLPGMATLLHVVLPNCGNMQHDAGRCCQLHLQCVQLSIRYGQCIGRDRQQVYIRECK